MSLCCHFLHVHGFSSLATAVSQLFRHLHPHLLCSVLLLARSVRLLEVRRERCTRPYTGQPVHQLEYQWTHAGPAHMLSCNICSSYICPFPPLLRLADCCDQRAGKRYVTHQLCPAVLCLCCLLQIVVFVLYHAADACIIPHSPTHHIRLRSLDLITIHPPMPQVPEPWY